MSGSAIEGRASAMASTPECGDGSFLRIPFTDYYDGRIPSDVRSRLPDVVLIPSGACEPRWFMAAQHVDPAEALRIVTDVGVAGALGSHGPGSS